MPTLTIRNLDAAVVETLRERARRHDRSLEAEIRSILTGIAGRPTPAEARAIAERIAAMSPKPQRTDSTLLVREDRDR